MRENNIISTDECFADDVSKSKKTFWEIFKDWENDDFKNIYSYLPDVDKSCSQLYNYHEYIWNKQRKKFLNIPEVHKIWNGYAYQLEGMVNGKKVSLGSDSFISIYWHYEQMQSVIKEYIVQNKLKYTEIYNEIKELDNGIKTLRYYDEIAKQKNQLKLFVWRYLQKANTIGGFALFPRHLLPTVNTARGGNLKISDRFDLTLECIRRHYEKDTGDNPLSEVLKADSIFFDDMFGSFKNYIDFFCLNPWIVEDKKEKYLVKNLIDNKPLNEWNFNETKVLPTRENWWTFYGNIISRLEERNRLLSSLTYDFKNSRNSW